MCGIAGIVNFNDNENIRPELLKEMTDIITHRGPDSEGFFIEKNIGMGFRRLSIIDLNTGDQPISDINDNATITFNGEIYNFLELKSSLILKGYKFKTSTDTEVIVNLYLEYGENCVKYLRGMFAFVIFDKRKNTIFGARDRFGIKPFYYSLNERCFIWGSELKCVKKGIGRRLTIDYNALNEYFTYGCIGGDRSIYSEVSKLKPAFTFSIDLNKGSKSFVIKKYWEISFEPDHSKTESDWIDLLDSKFSETVKLHMISDVPLGAFLSGGIDSSAVVAFMNKFSTEQIKTFSIGFKENKFNELEYARAVAHRYDTEHHELILEPESTDLLPKLISAFDEPFFDSSAIPTYYVSKLAKEFVTVALSGDGGDELFAGYESYFKANNINNSLFGKNIFKPGWKALYNLMPENIAGKGLAYYFSKRSDELAAYFCIMKQKERLGLYKEETLARIKNFEAENVRIDMLKRSTTKDFISKYEELDLLTYLPDDILTKVDRMSMQTSLESRVPILDHEFAELAFKIPSNMKIRGSSEGKVIFKKMLEGYLPEKVLAHKKQGFGLPISLWFKNDLKTYINDKLLNEDAMIYEYVRYDSVRKIIDGHNFGMRNFSGRIWTLLFLEEWLSSNKD